MKLSIYIITGWIVGLGTIPQALADSFDSKAQEGITHYNRVEYDQAATKFQASQQGGMPPRWSYSNCIREPSFLFHKKKELV